MLCCLPCVLSVYSQGNLLPWFCGAMSRPAAEAHVKKLQGNDRRLGILRYSSQVQQIAWTYMTASNTMTHLLINNTESGYCLDKVPEGKELSYYLTLTELIEQESGLSCTHAMDYYRALMEHLKSAAEYVNTHP